MVPFLLLSVSSPHLRTAILFRALPGSVAHRHRPVEGDRQRVLGAMAGV